jgi:hypothetical protein
VAGDCRQGNSNPARVIKFDKDLRLYWSDNYDGGGRNYARDLQSDFRGYVTLGVETVAGETQDGSYDRRTVVYDEYGRRIQIL